MNANAELTTMPFTEPPKHPDPENSISCALEDLRTFHRRNLAAALELDDGRNLDALAYACDEVMEKLDILLGQLEVDAEGMALERVNENQYAEW
jgi:hypothetical protein